MTSRSSAYVGLAAVAAIWGVSAIANGMAGYQLSNDPKLSSVLTAASVACDVLKAVTLFVILGAWLQKRWIVVAMASVLLVLTTGWSMRSAVYFASWGIAERTNALRHQEAVTEAELLLISTKQQRAQFLAEQQVDPTSKYRSIREAAKAANEASAQEFSKIAAEIKADLEKLRAAKPTPVIDPIADIMELPHAKVALWTALAFSLLLEMSSATGFWLISRSRLPKPRQEKTSENLDVDLSAPEPPVVDKPDLTTVARIEPESSLAKSVTPVPNSPSEIPKPNSEADFPEENPVIVDADTQRLVKHLRTALAPASIHDRVTLNEVSFAVNRLLPSSKRMHKKHERAGKLSEALLIAFPDCEKRRAGGQTWIHGVRLADLVPVQARA